MNVLIRYRGLLFCHRLEPRADVTASTRVRTSCAGVQQQSGKEIRLTHLTHLRTDSSSTLGAIICTRLRSLKPHSSERNGPRCTTLQSHLRTQREPFGTLHSASAVPRTGTLSLTCHGVLVVFDSNPTSNAQLLGAVERQRLRGQISRIWPSPHPTGLHPSPLAAKDVSCARVSPTQGGVLHPPLVVVCNCHKRVVPEVSEPALEVRELLLQLTPKRTAHFPTTKVTPPSAFLTRISRVRHFGQASLRSLSTCLLDLLPNHCQCMP